MKKSNFQIVVLIVFVVLIIAGVLLFALVNKEGKTKDTIGIVVIWGTLNQELMNKQLLFLRSENENTRDVTYVEKDERTYNDELVEAIASGIGPDLFLLSQSDILRQQNKIYQIPFESYSVRRFKDSFIEEGELYLNNTGIVALPFYVDPMVMYWNRDILSREGFSTSPEYWDEFFVLSPKITKRDQSSNISQATVALGEFKNITHAKDILSALIMQAGSPIMVLNEAGQLQNFISKGSGSSEKPAESALRFYTEFSNPIKSVYSWNRSLPDSRQAFISGDLTFYFGFASELSELRRANPNLNFDIAMFPQVREEETPLTFGRMQAVAISRSSRNLNDALKIAFLMTSNSSMTKLNELTGMPPVSRQLLRILPSDSYQPVFYNSALISQGWLDPDSEETEKIFQSMVEGITSGRFRITGALFNAENELDALIKSFR